MVYYILKWDLSQLTSHSLIFFLYMDGKLLCPSNLNAIFNTIFSIVIGHSTKVVQQALLWETHWIILVYTLARSILNWISVLCTLAIVAFALILLIFLWIHYNHVNKAVFRRSRTIFFANRCYLFFIYAISTFCDH